MRRRVEVRERVEVRGRVDASTPHPPGRPVDALSALLADPLDPGYRAAARRGDTTTRARAALLTGVGAFLIGVVLAVAFLHAHRSAPSDARARADLRARVAAAQSEAAGLNKTVRTLQSEADQRRAAALGSPANTGLSPAQLQAGTSAVQGPGISVELGPSPVTSTHATGRPGSTPISASVLTDLDVRAIVNELWNLDAQAVSVNDVRLTPTSTIRFAGLAVLVDFQPITAPYRIAAIGDAEALVTSFTGSAVAERYRTLSSADGFAFSTDEQRNIVMPASVLPDPRYAHLPSSASSVPTPPSSSPGYPSPLPPAGVTAPATASSPRATPRTGAPS